MCFYTLATASATYAVADAYSGRRLHALELAIKQLILY
jgi:hypothetical protein